MKKIAVVAAVVTAMALSAGCSAGQRTPLEVAFPAATTAAIAPSARTPVPIGTSAHDGNLAFVVNSVNRVASIPESYESAQPKGEYFIVDLTVTNVGTNIETYMDVNQLLIIDGKQFENATTPTATLSDNSISRLNPGIGIDTKVVFDVPVGAVPESIELHGDTLSPGVYASLPKPAAA